jgi:CRP-like cAMP-binding protein
MDSYPQEWTTAIQASFLGRLPRQTQEHLLQGAHAVEAAPKAMLYGESASSGGAHLVLVLSGLVRVFRTSRSGREVTVRHARTGDVLGLPSLITEASPAAAQAVVTSKVVVMSAVTLRARAQRDSQLAWAMAEEMAGSLFNIQERLAHNVLAPVRSRVARYLLDVAVRNGDCYVAATRHEDIATAIGTVREVVARVMTAFRGEGLVRRTGNSGIALADVDALRRVAQSDEFPDFRIRL